MTHRANIGALESRQMIDATSSPTTSQASAALMKKLFNSKAGAAVAMVEESVPGLDWIPTATITWCAWTYSCWNAEAKQKKQAAKAKKHDAPVATPVG